MSIFSGSRGKLFSILYLIKRRIPFFEFIFNNNLDAKNLIYVPYDRFEIHTEAFYKALYLYFEIKHKFQDVGVIREITKNIKGKNIFYVVDANTKNLSKNLVNQKFSSSKELKFPIHSWKSFVSELSKENDVYPTMQHINYWENKVYMHREFERLNVNTPKTVIKECSDLDYEDLSSRLGKKFLFKHPHSAGSAGLILISSQEDLDNTLKQNNDLPELIFQKLINMKKDLRVILIDNKIHLHYWRTNNEDEWKPTSTSYGSEVDFVFFPKNHEKTIIDTFKKFKLPQGAFDVCWEDDDINGEPIFLEISPAFQPNPDLKEFNVSLKKDQTYGDWKKTWMFEGSYAWVQRDNLKKFQRLYIEALAKYK